MASHHGLIPPPSGQTANFVNPLTHQASNIALHTTMLTAATIFVAIRLYTRVRLTRDIGVADLSTCGVLSSTVSLYVMLRPLALDRMADAQFQIEVAAECLYLPISATIKSSCLLFYHRIFRPMRTMRWLCLGGVAFICAAYLAFLLVNIFGWSPIRSHWNPTIPHHSVPAGTTAYGSGALNVLTDVYVVALPMPATWRL
nr:hypothetical protein CFP56_20592 [Quercus suber]